MKEQRWFVASEMVTTLLNQPGEVISQFTSNLVAKYLLKKLIFTGNGPAREQACSNQFVYAPPTRWPRGAPSSTGLIVYAFPWNLANDLTLLFYQGDPAGNERCSIM